ncbi:MAG: cupin domain-containing protein [Dehalococcoidia bacterium]|nr:cupin domain-containing protein [Dehalococcoidia bacterium]
MTGIPLQTATLPDDYTVLAPDGSEIRELVQTSKGSLVHCTLPPGAVSCPVSHRTVDEVWYFISGYGQVWRKSDRDEAVTDVERGISLTIETGTHFQFRNVSSDEPLTFIITTMPPWPGHDEAYPVPGRWPFDNA